MKIEHDRYVDGDLVTWEIGIFKVYILFRVLAFWDILDWQLEVVDNREPYLQDDYPNGFNLWLPTLSVSVTWK